MFEFDPISFGAGAMAGESLSRRDIEAALRKAYEDGREDGYKEGYEKGYEDGKAK